MALTTSKSRTNYRMMYCNGFLKRKDVLLQNAEYTGFLCICVRMSPDASDDMKCAIPIRDVRMLQKWTSYSVPAKLDKALFLLQKRRCEQ